MDTDLSMTKAKINFGDECISSVKYLSMEIEQTKLMKSAIRDTNTRQASPFLSGRFGEWHRFGRFDGR